MFEKLIQHPVCQLMRVHSLTGGYLLLAPTLMACMLSSIEASTKISVWWIGIFTLGSFTARFMGCAINDYWDQDIDKRVSRTANRPLAAGTISGKNALIVIVTLAIFNFTLMLSLPIEAIYLCILSFGLIVLYPLAKRFLKIPQLVLGLVFSMGIPIAWYTVNPQTTTLTYLWLYVANFCWIMYYDTLYAMADLEDDSKLDIGSSAKSFGTNTKFILCLLAISTVACYSALGVTMQLNWLWFLMCLFIFVMFIMQVLLLEKIPPLELFHQNGRIGLGCVFFTALCVSPTW